MEQKLYDLMDWPNIEGIIYSDLTNPRSLLGSHAVEGGLLIQSFYPNAVKATIKAANGKEYPMELADEVGYFATLLPVKNKFEYTVVYEFADGNTYEMYNAYEVPSMLKKKDIKAFNEGNCSDAYTFMGAHVSEYKGRKGVNFAVWAPFALRVSVVGTFNNWDGRVHQMERIDDSGIFELFVPDAKPGDMYKYEIRFKGGELHSKSDPYGFAAELRPGTASVIYDDKAYVWKDSAWIEGRDNAQYKNSPFAVYEVHLGSFMKPDDGRTFLNYRELAPLIIKHVKEQKFTHVELMPVMEHPLDESWGYQVTGYYAPTSRYGTPDDFKYMMDEFHKAGIGVILDWVPAHFPKDDSGLARFDGTCLYEHADPRKGEHPDWGTLCYNYGRREVANFLLSNAVFWAKEYHADGIRMDAVASMLYLDYGRKDGQWEANMYGGKENLEAVDFLKNLTRTFDKSCKGVMLIAEESTAWPKVTGDANDDSSLGFSYKWNMGWMNDFLYFMECDPLFRKGRYNSLTFSMIYAYTEDFILSLSHDEVVHGKKSMINKMPGATLADKMSNLRAAYAFMYTHVGKKLLFMGQDIGVENEWWEAESINWGITERPENAALKKFVADLNTMYRKEPALYELDFTPDGFEWINCISADENIVVYVRKATNGDKLLVVANFAPVTREKYKIGVPAAGKYKEISNSDAEVYGGSGIGNKRVIPSKKEECDGRENSITLTVPPMSVIVLRYTEADTAEKPVAKKPVAKKETVKKETVKKAPAKKEEPAKKEAAKKEPAKKAPVEKEEPVKKAPAKKEPAKKEPAKKEAAKKSPAKKGTAK